MAIIYQCGFCDKYAGAYPKIDFRTEKPICQVCIDKRAMENEHRSRPEWGSEYFATRVEKSPKVVADELKRREPWRCPTCDHVMLASCESCLYCDARDRLEHKRRRHCVPMQMNQAMDRIKKLANMVRGKAAQVSVGTCEDGCQDQREDGSSAFAAVITESDGHRYMSEVANDPFDAVANLLARMQTVAAAHLKAERNDAARKGRQLSELIANIESGGPLP